jgi:hypothetical protein
MKNRIGPTNKIDQSVPYDLSSSFAFSIAPIRKPEEKLQPFDCEIPFRGPDRTPFKAEPLFLTICLQQENTILTMTTNLEQDANSPAESFISALQTPPPGDHHL